MEGGAVRNNPPALIWAIISLMMNILEELAKGIFVDFVTGHRPFVV